MRNENGGKFNKRSYSKNADETCGSDHGVIVSGNYVQHHRHGLDWSAWFEGSCRCRCWRYVYLAFAGTCSYGQNGWTGACGTVYRTWRQRKGTRICTGGSTACCIYGNGICNSFAAFYQTDGRIFSACRCTGSCSGNVIYEDCLWADRIFIYDADTDWTLYGTGRFKDTFYSESCRPGHKYGSGSCVDSWSGDVSEAWCCRGCNCDSDSTGNRYEYHDSRNCHTKERKCTKRNQAFGKNPAGISAGNL